MPSKKAKAKRSDAVERRADSFPSDRRNISGKKSEEDADRRYAKEGRRIARAFAKAKKGK